MERLIKVGEIKPKKSSEIKHSRIGLGFEKLDRNVFDPNKAYRFVGESGIKWARLQSGWQRTEKEKGIYDFTWLDDIVDHMIAMGVEPWLCLCYGNQLYTPDAAKYFGAVGCPPIATEEERTAWTNYVKATVKHYHGRIHYYEVWNEPDLPYAWKHGVNPQELSDFTVATAKACKEADPDCEVLGFVLANKKSAEYREALCATGVCDVLDGITYHGYHVSDDSFEEAFNTYDKVRQTYKPSLKIIQGESGTQSRGDGSGALKKGAWTPLKQAKFLLRHLIIDLACGVEFTSYFSCMDMVEALRGLTGDVKSYLDYGYFGVIGADFDEEGHSTGEYTPKPSYKALQSLASVFCNDYELCELPITPTIEPSIRVIDEDDDFAQTRHYGFSKPNGSYGLCYWMSRNILKETFESTVSLKFKKDDLPGDIRLADLRTGDIYQLTDEMIREDEEFMHLINIPVTDSPLLLTFGDFII